VIRITALPEQVSFDVRWFVVQAGRSVQIVLVNPDAMPHNVVIGRPGAVEAIGTAAASMAPSADPAVKPYVPALPSVLFSTRLVQQGESERLAFTAPTEPGAYVSCTFPGHWLRICVMLVVRIWKPGRLLRPFPSTR
jgi:azurin